jgi:O-antigen/teichoic acid export membrane protein
MRSKAMLGLGLEKVHLLLFRHEMSPEMKDFLKNLSWSFFGGFMASALMLIVNVGMGRYFGPEEYGKYNFVLSISQILLIFLYLGIDVSSVRFLAGSKTKSEKIALLSSSFYFVVALIIITWTVYLLLEPIIGTFLGTDRSLVFFMLVLGSVLGIKGIVDGYMRAFSLFRFQAGLRIAEAVIIIALLTTLLSIVGIREYQYYVSAIAGGALVFSMVALYRLREWFGRFTLSSLKVQLSYGRVLLVGMVLGAAFNSLDKIIIGKYLGMVQLGMYSAYFMTSTNLIAQMTQIFNNVFFPAISRTTDTSYLAKLDKIAQWLFFPAALALSAVIYVIMLIFGKAYGADARMALGFGFLAALQIVFTVNATIITAISKRLLKKYFIYLNLVNAGHMALYGMLVFFDLITIPTLLGLFFVNFFLMVMIQRKLIKSYSKDQMSGNSLNY